MVEINNNPSVPVDLTDKLSHAHWKERHEGFQELLAYFKSIENGCQNEFLAQQASQWKVYFNEKNTTVLLEIVNCFQLFIEKSEPALLIEI